MGVAEALTRAGAYADAGADRERDSPQQKRCNPAGQGEWDTAEDQESVRRRS